MSQRLISPLLRAFRRKDFCPCHGFGRKEAYLKYRSIKAIPNDYVFKQAVKRKHIREHDLNFKQMIDIFNVRPKDLLLVGFL